MKLRKNRCTFFVVVVQFIIANLKFLKNLLIARKNELTTEDHLKSLAEREAGRLKQENQRLEYELQKLKEKRNTCEVNY